jgi:methylmalonyl-CoA mutase
VRERYAAESQTYEVRERSIRVDNQLKTLSGTRVPKVALPRTGEWGELVRYFRRENLPGRFPFTAGVFPFRRESEDPARMFAGEGTPERTNRRFHLLCRGQSAARLSTAFDSVTLYGCDPDERLDVYGKIGNSGVSVCTVDDAVTLYSGFDLCAPTTSVSMTINGPAPMLLAFFLNAAIDQQVECHLRETGRLEQVRARLADRAPPACTGSLPQGHDGLGLALLGASGDEVVDADTYARIRADVLRRVRGTVQADILKEDQAQNTCIFSTEFALGMMGDIQQYFSDHAVKNFYSVSVSGYHIAEAGANPITQLAFTLANGFTYCEYYLARGMAIDAFAPNFSFFFSNGLDAEYSVIGRVARRIWALAMRERYGAGERAQKLKYHVQTSGRSLHAQEMAFNDIRTTLQALVALQDQCNSLHTNAYDEAVTTPTEESVRRALAIQLIINRELEIARNENPLQGAYVIEELTDLVEEAVLREFERLSARAGVLGAMETGYQRGRIQEESLAYESMKDSGALPIIGVNTFERPDPQESLRTRVLMRSSEEEKRAQLDNLRAFRARHAARTPGALRRLQHVARAGGNVFEELLETVKVASLGQISDALFEVGGRYRRSM